MKNFALFIALSVQILCDIKAQTYTHEFGKYSGEDFKLARYEKDTTAEAVVIYDIGKTYFQQTDEGFKMIFERSTKIKIFKKSGIKWAQVEIPYYEKDNDLEQIVELSGNTYNFENGSVRITALNSENTYVEKINENWFLKKFAMPDIKEGSVFEVRYKISSPYFSNFRSWEFQREIPVLYSEYTTKMIPFYEYTYILQGASKLDSFKKYEETGMEETFRTLKYHNLDYEFIMKEVPAFKDESFITSPEDYIIKLDFQLSAFHSPEGTTEQILTTWPKLIDHLLDDSDFGRYLKVSQKKAKEILSSMQIDTKSPKEKAEIIENYVKLNYNWDGFQSKYASKSVKDFLKTKTGNSADINLFLTGLLREAGVDAYPAIISTRDNGKIKLDYPLVTFFNYVIAIIKIDDKYLTLDATEPLSNFAEIPTRCLNDRGLIIQKDKVEWISYVGNSLSLISYSLDIYPNNLSDTIPINFKIVSKGYDALNLRKKYYDGVKKLKSELSIENFVFSDSLSVANLTEKAKQFEINFNIFVLADKVEDKIIIAPFYNMPINTNPFTQPLRTYPIDMVYKRMRYFTSTIHIPEGYKIFSKPENMFVDNDLVRIRYNTEMIDKDKLKVAGIYEFKKDVYSIFNYVELKSYFNKIIDKFNDKVILVKN
jgi:transglutaminase-like putative cysteine protease